MANPELEKRPTEKTSGIKAFTPEGLEDLISELKLPKYRTKQLVEWLYGRAVTSYDEMTNLSKQLRAQLAEKYPLYTPEILRKQVSEDGTRKYLLRYHDGTTVETVGIPSKNRLTVCFSTQAGCPLRCAFCATGKSGLVRNLAPGEIVDQLSVVANDFGSRPTNAVAMGQGEPFLNYDYVIGALRFINAKEGLNIGARHLTVSTSGILPQIRRFSQEPEQFTLAVSLHSANQDTRNALMPGVRQYSLDRLSDSLRSYNDMTGRRISLEYAMIDGVNDTMPELNALQKFCKKLMCHVNLIPINSVPGSRFSPSPYEQIELFQSRLQQAGIECTIRNSRGSDIDSACGQLSQRVSK